MLSIVAHILFPGARPPSVRIQSVVGLMDVALAHLDNRIPAPAASHRGGRHIIDQVTQSSRAAAGLT